MRASTAAPRAVSGPDEGTIIAKHVVIATGSDPRSLPGAPFDEEFILSNDGALRIGAVPKHLAMIGSGVVGLELGSVWRRLGAKVTILEAQPDFLPTLDCQVSKEALKQFMRQGLKIEVGVKVGQVQRRIEQGVKIDYTSPAGESKSVEVDRLIVSIGRVPNTRGLNPEAIGLTLDGRAPSRSTTTAARTFRTSGPSVTSCAAPCSRTRPRMKASLSWSASPVNSRRSTSTRSRG